MKTWTGINSGRVSENKELVIRRSMDNIYVQYLACWFDLHEIMKKI